MNNNTKTTVSKLMSLVLRHKPDVLDLELDHNGWVSLDLLVEGILQKHSVTIEDILDIVETNNKKRFEISQDGNYIRAVQGHTIDVDVELENVLVGDDIVLYHGTPSKNLKNILKKGILKMNRNHVHLSKDLDTAIAVAKRYKEPFHILTIRIPKDEKGLLRSKNGVYLIEYIPPEYIKLYINDKLLGK